jgi:quinol monooxygenase YgiN
VYGLIGKVRAAHGRRDELAAVLAGMDSMPGCLSYIVAADPSDQDVLWVTEVWESQDAHNASLTLPAVREAIVAGTPLIAGFESRIETAPVGGIGIDQPAE